MKTAFDERLVGDIDFVGLFLDPVEEKSRETDRDRAAGGFEVGKGDRFEIGSIKIVFQLNFGPKVSFLVFVFEAGEFKIFFHIGFLPFY